MRLRTYHAVVVLVATMVGEALAFWVSFPFEVPYWDVWMFFRVAMLVIALTWFVLLRKEFVQLRYMLTLFLGIWALVVAVWGELLAAAFWTGPVVIAVLNGFYVVALTGVTIGVMLLIRMYRRTIEELSEKQRRLIELSITDDLTGLYNARYFYRRLEEEIARSRRYGRPLSLLFIDLDDFKRFNDTYGHLAGDRVLRKVARVLKESLRENDSAYRYGGEEFVIILPETGAEEGCVAAERVRRRIEDCSFRGEEKVKVTASVGVVEYREGDAIEDFVRRADQAMYRAKAEGKNRVFLVD